MKRSRSVSRERLRDYRLLQAEGLLLLDAYQRSPFWNEISRLSDEKRRSHDDPTTPTTEVGSEPEHA